MLLSGEEGDLHAMIFHLQSTMTRRMDSISPLMEAEVLSTFNYVILKGNERVLQVGYYVLCYII